MRHVRLVYLLRILSAVVLSAGGLAGCTESGATEEKDYGEFRLRNNSPNTTTLYINQELMATVPPGKTKSARAPDGLVEVSVRTELGAVIWKQYADVPDNAYAQYTVNADGSVVTTAGNIAVPEVIGSRKEQIRLRNDAAFPVDVVANGELLGIVGPYLYGTFRAPKGTVLVSFRKHGGGTLLEQALDVPRNGYIAYIVKPNGTVIATGGEIEPNFDAYSL